MFTHSDLKSKFNAFQWAAYYLKDFNGGRCCQVLVQLSDEFGVALALFAKQIELLLLIAENKSLGM